MNASNKRYSIREFVSRIATRTRDTRLSAESTPRNPGIYGRAWQGDLKSIGVALGKVQAAIDEMGDPVEQADARAKVADVVNAYANLAGGGMRVGAFGSFSTARPEKEFSLADEESTDSPVKKMQRAADAKYNPGKVRARDFKFPKQVTASDIQRANLAYWH